MFLKPTPYIDEAGDAQGLRQVVDPDFGDVLPDDGRDVPETEYWTRRLRDGDVELID